MTSSISAPAKFNGVGGGKIFKHKDAVGRSTVFGSYTLWWITGILGLALAVTSGILFATLGENPTTYDLSSSDYITYTGSGMNSLGVIFLIATIALMGALLFRHSGFLVAGTMIFLAAIMFSIAFSSSTIYGKSESTAELESWLLTNEGLTPNPFATQENISSAITASEAAEKAGVPYPDESPNAEGTFSMRSFTNGQILPLVNEDGENVQGLFVDSGDGKYVFSKLPPRSE